MKLLIGIDQELAEKMRPFNFATAAKIASERCRVNEWLRFVPEDQHPAWGEGIYEVQEDGSLKLIRENWDTGG